MKLKFLLILAVIVGFLGLIMFDIASKSQQQRKEVPSTNRLKWLANEAKKDGQKKTVIPAPISDYAGSENSSIEQAFKDYTVVVAQPIAKQTYQANDNSLITWYKFRILDALTPIKGPVCIGCFNLSPPADMPLDYIEEFLVPRNGGTLMIDGVEIEEREGGFPEFRENQKYLLFISLYPNRVAITAGGPIGVFTVDEKETLTPFSNRSDKIREGLKAKFNNSLPLLKQHLKSH